MRDKLLIYFGDFDHFTKGNRISIPLNIASIAGYCQKLFGEKIEFKLFKRPEELIKKLREAPPDILALSFYMWNANLSLKIIEYAKSINPAVITVIGGPSVARNSDKYKDIFNANPCLDIIVLDQGEKSFSNILTTFFSEGTKDLLEKNIAGCAIHSKKTGEIKRGEIVEDKENLLNIIPSPYLTGLLDPFLKEGFLPLLETTRGCPHSCTYCGWGDKFYSRLHVKNEDLVYQELTYIGKHSGTKELSINDSNFGIMGDRDKRIAIFMKEMHDKTGFPVITDYATTKVKTDQSIDIMKIIADITGLYYFGLQTLTAPVLEKCKRTNIPLDKIKDLAGIAKEKNLGINADLIFGLPGETTKSFFETVSKLVSLGIDQPSTYNLRLLPGTELAEKEREKYHYKTKFRPFNNRYGEYEFTPGAKPTRIIEVEEVAFESDTFNKNDFMLARKFGFISWLLLSYGALSETLLFLSARGIDAVKIMEFILQTADKYPQLSKLMKRYEQLAANELFDSEEELKQTICGSDKEWNDLLEQKGNYFKINLGFVGYCILENTEVIEEIKSIVSNYVKNKLAPDQMKNYYGILEFDGFHQISAKKNDGKLKKTDLEEEKIVDQKFDFVKWIQNKYAGNLADYAYPTPMRFSYRINKFADFLKTIEELKDFSDFNFYERILMKVALADLKRISARVQS